jgi:hypothetical protein
MEHIKKWRHILNPLRFIISGGLLFYLIWRANPVAIWEVWKGIDVRWLLLAVVVQFVGIAVSAAKWGVILAARGQRLSYSWLLSTYLVGQFANNFLPTTVGGDALRTAQLGRRIGSYSQAGASIFLERLTGFLALSLIANIALIMTFASFHGSQVSYLYLITVGFTLTAVAAVVASFFAPWFERKLGRYLPQIVRQPMHKVASSLRSYFPQGKSLAAVIWLSLVFQTIWIGMNILCGLALNIDAPMMIYAVIAPVTDIVGLAPFFINNLGPREFVFTLYLEQVGVAAEMAIALALTVFAVRLAVSVLGGLVVLFGGADLNVATNRSQEQFSQDQLSTKL